MLQAVPGGQGAAEIGEGAPDGTLLLQPVRLQQAAPQCIFWYKPFFVGGIKAREGIQQLWGLLQFPVGPGQAAKRSDCCTADDTASKVPLHQLKGIHGG